MPHSLLPRFRARTPLADDTDELIRSELFSIERLEQHAQSLAAAQGVDRRQAGRPIAQRVRHNGQRLLEAYRAIAAAIREERAITPAAEWLVDNFHIAEDQIREIRADLPAGFYGQLPKLADGPLAGYPRVFGIAWAFVAHTDSLFDPQTLCRFVRAYQSVQPLTIGELWAVAITLRVVLVENLRRSADRIVSSRAARQQADAVADRLLGFDSRQPEPVTAVLRPFEGAPLRRAFAVQLIQRLRDQDPAVTPALRWLDERLAAQGTKADDIVHQEHQRQGAMNVTVRNVITSMRLMSAVDWTELFESVSLVDAALRAESNFAAMDFPTRDAYRHAIEELARGSGCTELEVARRAIQAAKSSGAGDAREDDPASRDNRTHDPGYYLISSGRHAFETALGFRLPVRDWIARAYTSLGLLGYLGTILFVTACILAVAALAAGRCGVGGGQLWILALLGLIPASDVAVALVNRHVTHQFGPTVLPALELRDGVPASLRTVVAVPTLLTSVAAIDEQIERLEVHHLTSPDDDLCFVLLSDWTDAASEHIAGDQELLAAAAAGIARLNGRHGPAADGDRFVLLHRRRVWNASEGKWIGWERKRGKLHELNRLLRGARDTTFVTVDGYSPHIPVGVRYVITLDADTRLPRGTARRLVGKMAHVLNRARLDPRTACVVEGYAVLQPRVTPTLPMGHEGSIFQRLSSGPPGIDPYAFAVSDVYQDLLSEGSYTGKGIYEVDTFEAALAGRIPENTVLSHDLLEGTFARAGLVSDIEVVEEFPSRYDVAAARQHRWARGDWQLLPWIFGHGRGTHQNPAHRVIPLIGRWKMLDNLRRTLLAPAAFLALVMGWMLPVAAAAVWSGCVLAMIATPALLPFAAGVIPRRTGISKRSHLRAMGLDLTIAVSQIALLITLLAHQAWLMTDSVGRTLFRLAVSRRHMLEWVTAAQAKFSLPLNTAGFYRRMAGGVVLAAAALVAICSVGHPAMVIAAPFVVLWMLSPAAAQWVSRPAHAAGTVSIAPTDARVLRLIARRTWSFFETFVTAEDHMLPPDNFQEEPRPVVAHRTSPTNCGLYLLSVVAARDFGWLGTLDDIDRLTATLETMRDLERFRGHFYNWYDTHDLRPLEPKYVSSVDSGNLAGHLIAVANACGEIMGAPIITPRWYAGIEDHTRLMRAALSAAPVERRVQTVSRAQVDEAIDTLLAVLRRASTNPASVARQLAEVAGHTETITDMAETLAQEGDPAACASVLQWTEAMRRSIRSHHRDIEEVMPWARLLREDPQLQDALGSAFDSMPTLIELPDRCADAIAKLRRHRATLTAQNASAALLHADALIAAFTRSADAASDLSERLTAIRALMERMVAAMDFGFLLDPARQLLSIGYRVADGSLDPSCYDLLASEARLASFVAIAKGDVPARHWFRLGRSLTPVDLGSALISWSGSMFEYLMPSLVMRAPPGSLLEQTSRLIVHRQMAYGAELGVPWGVSESAFNARDLEFTYQYSNFGVPGLGLKRGLSEDAVIAPYATALATMVDTAAAVQNFSRLTAAGASGRYGFYEALDYTPARVPEGEKVAVVRAYMAHHQGMTVVAIANAVDDGRMRARFHTEPIVQATELLLQERMPRDVAVARPRAEEVKGGGNVADVAPPVVRRFRSPHDLVPRTHLLSNGRYAVMMTAAGSGYSGWRNLSVTRWHEDVTCDDWGTYIFLRDARSGAVWSAGYQPSAVEPDRYEVTFAEDRAEIVRRDGTITTTLEVAVSAEDDAEVRRVSISNGGARTRHIELTSYAEMVLAEAAADAAHPAFSKLFVHTEFIADVGALVAMRRPRSPNDPPIWAAHVAVLEGERIGDMQWETDRARFLGRGHDIHAPISIIDGQPLSNTVGAVLDPIFSLRYGVRIAPGATARVAFWTVVGRSRGEVMDLVDKHHDAAAFDRAVTLAWTQAQVQLHHLGIGADEVHLFQRLANRILYADQTLRPPSAVLQRGQRPQSALWPHGISGDLPLVLVRISETEDLEIVRQLLRAHEYWRLKGLAVDLVILNERSTSYAQDLQSALEALVRSSQSRPRSEQEHAGGRVIVLRADLVALDVRNLLQAAARAVLIGRRGSLSEQVRRLPVPVRATPAPKRPAVRDGHAVAPPRPSLDFFNGLGGFTADGREYVTILGEGQWTPAPWINVIANPAFGFQVSVEGCGYTWAANSREHQLTAWSNDPVVDRPSEVMYIRDEDSGVLWSPTALPIREDGGHYTAAHGQGYSRFERVAHGIGLELLQYVAADDPIKIVRLRLHNQSARSRRLGITAYLEWVLGTARGVSSPHIVTAIEPVSGAMLARNPWSIEFGDRVAFADLRGRQTAWTADRTEFLGRNGTLAYPAALAAALPLSGRVGAGLDACCALQTSVELGPKASTEIVCFLGEAANETAAASLIAKYRAADLDDILDTVKAQWDSVLETVQVKTPDAAMNVLVNRWLLYQTLSCRLWARSAFYQASGAYGFRDQLQDVMALAVSKPELTRAHLLRAAARQFVEGDVQHWWLPPSGQGVRTHISDDRLWLPYVTAHYVQVTGDDGILDEVIPFVEGPGLHAGDSDAFFQPLPSDEHGTLFEHCARALDCSLGVGDHGLPLIGTGDWNDGMNRVGAAGKGESVWLGWFLHATLSAFASLAERRDEMARAGGWRDHARALHAAIERCGWDGAWYRRGYFDDGTPLGSACGDECQIDCIAQSWAVISGAADPARARQAMTAVDVRLVRRAEGLLLLFAPPFDHTALDPGYIKGYPPGLRENGGQYTHAAVWSVIAFALLGDGDKAAELFALLNPITHATTRAAVHRYKVEPYAVAADVYAHPAHLGRGGWTWYTGAAGWMYRAALEWILGFQVQGATLRLDPCLPSTWPGVEMVFRYHSARYEIAIDNSHGATHGVVRLELDGKVVPSSPPVIPLTDDGAAHQVRVTLGDRNSAASGAASSIPGVQ